MSKMEKYPYNRDLKIFSFLNPPVILPILPFMQFFMKGFYYTDISDKKVSREKLTIPVKDDTAIRAFVYTPRNAARKDSPCVIFYHGGGFVYNAAPHHFSLARSLAAGLGVKVFFIDYRLAPKHPFPAAVDDAFYSYRYISENAELFGIDRKRIALCGDSAGGNLAAVTCIRARDEKIEMPCAQMLLYPFVDDDTESESMKKFTDTPMCNTVAARAYKKAYINEEDYSPREWFSAVDVVSLASLPEAYVETAEFDCLHDGGVRYYERLIRDGVKACLFETKGTMHGYDIATKSEIYSVCMKKRTDFLKRIFDERKQTLL